MWGVAEPGDDLGVQEVRAQGQVEKAMLPDAWVGEDAECFLTLLSVRSCLKCTLAFVSACAFVLFFSRTIQTPMSHCRYTLLKSDSPVASRPRKGLETTHHLFPMLHNLISRYPTIAMEEVPRSIWYVVNRRIIPFASLSQAFAGYSIAHRFASSLT